MLDDRCLRKNTYTIIQSIGNNSSLQLYGTPIRASIITIMPISPHSSAQLGRTTNRVITLAFGLCGVNESELYHLRPANVCKEC